MSLRRVAHREDVIREERCFAPGRRERHVEPDQALIGQGFDPGEPVGVGPHGVVDAGEIHLEPAAPVLQEMGEEKGELVDRQRVLTRPGELVPRGRMRRDVYRPRHKLVPSVRVGAAFGGHGAQQRVEQKEATRHLPTSQVPRRRAAPGMRRQLGARGGDDLGDRAQHVLIDA